MSFLILFVAAGAGALLVALAIIAYRRPKGVAGWQAFWLAILSAALAMTVPDVILALLSPFSGGIVAVEGVPGAGVLALLSLYLSVGVVVSRRRRGNVGTWKVFAIGSLFMLTARATMLVRFYWPLALLWGSQSVLAGPEWLFFSAGALLFAHALCNWFDARPSWMLACAVGLAVTQWVAEAVLWYPPYVLWRRYESMWLAQRIGEGPDLVFGAIMQAQRQWAGVLPAGILCAMALLGPLVRSGRASEMRTCEAAGCGAENDPGARFCRRCGRAMG